MSKKYLLTIGIPAFNEENSLPQLLNSLSKIKIPNFDRLILISDGSTDKTSRIIKGTKFPGIKITKIIDPVRKGKINRLNQIFSLSKTDFLLILDADIQINKNTITRLLKSAINFSSVLAVSHQVPIKPQNFFGKIIYTGYQMWDEMRTSNAKYLDNVENYYGASSLYHYDFYHKLRIPQELNDERKYIYYSAKKAGKFIYDKGSIIFYHPVSTLKDFYLLGRRSVDIDKKVQKYFENSINKNFKIPYKLKLKIMLKYLIHKPFSILTFIFLKYFIRIIKTPDPLAAKGMWTIASSTKI